MGSFFLDPSYYINLYNNLKSSKKWLPSLSISFDTKFSADLFLSIGSQIENVVDRLPAELITVDDANLFSSNVDEYNNFELTPAAFALNLDCCNEYLLTYTSETCYHFLLNELSTA